MTQFVFFPSPSHPASPLYQLPRRSSNRKCTQALIIITLLTPAGGIKNSYLLKTPLLRNKHHRRLGVRHSPCNEIGNVMKSSWALNHTLSFLVMSPPLSSPRYPSPPPTLTAAKRFFLSESNCRCINKMIIDLCDIDDFRASPWRLWLLRTHIYYYESARGESAV